MKVRVYEMPTVAGGTFRFAADNLVLAYAHSFHLDRDPNCGPESSPASGCVIKFVGWFEEDEVWS